MAAISGVGGNVYLGSVQVASVKEWQISGFVMGTYDTTVFGDAGVKTFIPDDTGDPGTISFSGNYDPNGPAWSSIQSLCEAGTTFTTLRLYPNATTCWRVESGGTVVALNSKAVTLARSGLGSISFNGKVTGKAMELVDVV